MSNTQESKREHKFIPESLTRMVCANCCRSEELIIIQKQRRKINELEQFNSRFGGVLW
jgi:hypothetical protein